MQIVTAIPPDSSLFESSVVTIGNFDGVHLGHGELFRRLKTRGVERGCPAVVVTFDPHPLSVVTSDNVPLLITTLAQKIALIAEYGIDAVVVIPFTREFSQQSAEEFVRQTLCGALGMHHILIGHDYAFGRGRQGNFATLERLGAELDFTLEDLDPFGKHDMVYSSSLVRRLVLEGDLQAAAMVLGRYHLLSGVVVPGKHRGEGLGFPTANLETANQLIPPDGVYAVWVTLNGQLEQGACNIGNNPTFGAAERTIEVFLLDYSCSLYGSDMTIHFVKRLRDVQTFPDVTSLKMAITGDVATVRNVLAASDQHLVHPWCGSAKGLP